MSFSVNNPYDFCIVGAGLVGSSIARHASAKPGLSVCLIGPQEPKPRADKTGQEVFGAHYDEGRITRTTDLDPVWTHISKKSQARYRELEALSGICFYSEVGSLFLGDSRIQEQLNKLAPDHVQRQEYSKLLRKHPYINVGEKDTGLFNFVGGVVNPRRQVDAAITVALKNGCDVIRDVVSQVKKTEDSHGTAMVLETEGGKTIYSKKVVLATNVFTQSRALLPDNIKLKFEPTPQTVVFAEVDSEDLEKLKDMPCIMYWGAGSSRWYKDYPRNPDGRIKIYMLPPILYPDGKFYIKIGHSDLILKSTLRREDISKWHCGNGDPWVIDHLTNLVKSMFSGIKFKSFHGDACVTMVTPTGRPYIQKIHDQLGVAIGGNGHASKCCDEIGKIAADMMTSSTWNYQLPQKAFEVIFENENEAFLKKSKI